MPTTKPGEAAAQPQVNQPTDPVILPPLFDLDNLTERQLGIIIDGALATYRIATATAAQHLLQSEGSGNSLNPQPELHANLAEGQQALAAEALALALRVGPMIERDVEGELAQQMVETVLAPQDIMQGSRIGQTATGPTIQSTVSGPAEHNRPNAARGPVEAPR